MHPKYFKATEVGELFSEILSEMLKLQRDPETIILDETDLCKLLHISKRHAIDLRKEGKIRYAKDGGKIYYKLSWVLEYIDKFRVDVPENLLLTAKLQNNGKCKMPMRLR